MKNNNFLTAPGTISEKINNSTFRVELNNKVAIIATIANRFRIARARGKGTKRPQIVIGDKVIVAIPANQTDLKRGMIIEFVK